MLCNSEHDRIFENNFIDFGEISIALARFDSSRFFSKIFRGISMVENGERRKFQTKSPVVEGSRINRDKEQEEDLSQGRCRFLSLFFIIPFFSSFFLKSEIRIKGSHTRRPPSLGDPSWWCLSLVHSILTTSAKTWGVHNTVAYRRADPSSCTLRSRACNSLGTCPAFCDPPRSRLCSNSRNIWDQQTF